MSNLQNVYEGPSIGNETDYDDVLVDDTEGGVVLLEENSHRKSALIINLGPGAIRITTDGSEPTSTHGKPVGAGGYLSMSDPYCSPKQVRACRQTDADATVNASEID